MISRCPKKTEQSADFKLMIEERTLSHVFCLAGNKRLLSVVNKSRIHFGANKSDIPLETDDEDEREWKKNEDDR